MSKKKKVSPRGSGPPLKLSPYDLQVKSLTRRSKESPFFRGKDEKKKKEKKGRATLEKTIQHILPFVAFPPFLFPFFFFNFYVCVYTHFYLYTYQDSPFYINGISTTERVLNAGIQICDQTLLEMDSLKIVLIKRKKHPTGTSKF